jgi:DNA polymerase-1
MALAYRGYYAFIKNPLKNSKGQNTSSVFVFLSAMLKIIREEKAENLVVVFDADKETFRHKMYKAYKANRPPMPDELKSQIPLILRLLETMNITMIRMPGIEADDIIGTLAMQAAEQGNTAFILSKDKDFAQLIGKNIILIDPKMQEEKTIYIKEKHIREKFGVPPEKMVDYLALVGDASDNIPGVAKIGPKTASELLNTHGNLDAIYTSLDKITKKAVKKNLEENRENAYLSRKLVSLKTDIDIKEKSFEVGQLEGQAYIDFLKEMEFKGFLRQAPAGSPKKEKAVKYQVVNDKKTLKALQAHSLGAACLAVDTETDSLDVYQANLIGLSLSFKAGEAFYIPVAHRAGKNIDSKDFKAALSSILANKKSVKTGHNLKFDLFILKKHGFKVHGPLFDTMVAAYLLNPGTRQHNLDFCALDCFSYQMQPITALIGEKKKDQISFDLVDIDSACFYSCEDADYTLRLKMEYEKRLKAKKLNKLFWDIEMPLLEVLLDMEESGIKIDTPFLKELALEYEKVLSALHKQITGEAGEEFNINSPKQLSEILFNKLGIKPIKKIKTGYSTDSEVLETLAKDHKLPQLILNHRQYTKLKSTYVDALPVEADRNHLIHTSFNQTITATGRLSSSKPNLQNIPVRTETGREIRKAFIPRKRENLLISADYSQIELRVLAHISNEKTLIEAFLNDDDIHKRTASLVFNIMPALVSSQQRSMAKTVNFGIVYGQSAFGLSQQLHIPQKEAKKFIDNYFQSYPGIRKYMDTSMAFAKENGFVETLYGRRRYLPEINSDNRAMRGFAERTAINTPIQGTAADLIKIAMIRINKKIRENIIKAALLLQVHDELIFEVDKKEAEGALTQIKREMEGVAKLKVPLKVDVGKGRNWLEAH